MLATARFRTRQTGSTGADYFTRLDPGRAIHQLEAICYRVTLNETTSNALTRRPTRLGWIFASGRVVGAACRNRTDDLLITSETLYRLS